LHTRSLNNTDEAAAQRVQSQLEDVVEETRALSSQLKQRIQALERQGGAGPKRQQTALVKSKFLEAIQGYQTVEQQFRQRYKQRMERQLKIGTYLPLRFGRCTGLMRNDSETRRDS
jgi:syntaxin 1B/2/3